MANKMSRTVSAMRSGRAVVLLPGDGGVVIVVWAVCVAEVGVTVGNRSLLQ